MNQAVAEARREKQIDAPGEVIMAAAEEIDENYDAPNFGVTSQKKMMNLRKSGRTRKRGICGRCDRGS